MQRAAVVVGREVELDLLLRSVHAARGREARSVFLVGEGGVGKTRLLGEAASAGRQLGLGVLSGRAPITTPTAFSIVAEALRSWLRGHPMEPNQSPFDRGIRLVLPEWSAPLDSRDELAEAQLRLLALEGVVQLVRDIAAANDGAIVLLDDLHAADPESLEVVRYLATAAVEGVVLVGALRLSEAATADQLIHTLRGSDTTDIVELAPLPERAVGDLVAALLDADPPQALVDDIMTRTDGVPLLVEEVLDAHLRAGSVELGAAGPVWRGGTLTVPRTIREMVAARLARLSLPHREILVAGAVLGDFETSMISAVALIDGNIVNAALADGVHAGLLETTGGAIGFRHAIIREAVLDITLPHSIELLHRSAANVLATGGSADGHVLERRARHLVAVGERDAAAHLLVAASQIRMDEHALLGAERLARTARDLSRRPETRVEAADMLARSLSAQGRWSEALEIDEATTAEHGETPDRRHRMAMSALEAGRPDLATTIIERAFRAGDGSPLLQLAEGRVALVSGEGARALDSAQRVLDRSSFDEDLDIRLQALELLGRSYDYLGQREAAEAAWSQQAEEAAAARRTQAQLRAVVQLGKVELFAGRRPARLWDAVNLARAAGALVELAWAEENLAIGLALHGDLAAAAAVLADAIPRCREQRLDQLAYLLVSQAVIESCTGGESSDALLAEAEALVPTADLRMASTAIRGDIALREGRYADAVRWQETSEEIRRTMPGIVPSDSTCWMVWSLAAMGRADDAARVLREVREMPDLARWYTRPILVAAADALLVGDESGVDNAIAASTAHMPLDVALMRVLGAEIIQGSAQVRWLREALDLYEAAGVSTTADRVRKLLRAAGGSVPRRRTVQPVPGELAVLGVTAREAEVLELLGDGLSNADIAERLYLSVRTVESHVSSLLTKLDASSRGQLTVRSGSITFES